MAIPNLHDDDVRVSGRLEVRREGTWLEYERYEPVVRQRFTIAHELGHHRLDQPQRIVCPSDQIDPPISESDGQLAEVEATADAFAAAFLIPAASLREDLARFGVGIPFLAQLYSVSKAAMRRRIRVLEHLGACASNGVTAQGDRGPGAI